MNCILNQVISCLFLKQQPLNTDLPTTTVTTTTNESHEMDLLRATEHFAAWMYNKRHDVRSKMKAVRLHTGLIGWLCDKHVDPRDLIDRTDELLDAEFNT